MGVKENIRESKFVNLFPNPSESKNTLEISNQKESNCTIELYDIMGRFIKTVYSGRIHSGKSEIECDLNKLANSMYIYYIKIDDQVYFKKFIKE